MFEQEFYSLAEIRRRDDTNFEAIWQAVMLCRIPVALKLNREAATWVPGSAFNEDESRTSDEKERFRQAKWTEYSQWVSSKVYKDFGARFGGSDYDIYLLTGWFNVHEKNQLSLGIETLNQTQTPARATNTMIAVHPWKPPRSWNGYFMFGVSGIESISSYYLKGEDGGRISKVWIHKDDLQPFILHVSPAESAKENTNPAQAERHAANREKVFGAALTVIKNYPEQCRGRGDKLSAQKIAEQIDENARIIWHGELDAPLTKQRMADHIRDWLNRLDKPTSK